MTLYLTSPQMGYSIGQAGIVFGLFGFGAFTGAFLGGKLTDKIGFYPVQLITLIGGGILFMVLGQMKSYSLICLFTYLLSFVNEAFRPANSTAIAFYCKEENRTRSYSLNRLAINIGWAVGSGLGGLLAKHSYNLLFWVDGSTNIIAAFVMWYFLKPVNYKPVKQRSGELPTTSAYQDKTYILFVVITAVFACCFFQIFTNLPVFFKRELHFSEPHIGLLMALNGVLIALIEMVLIYKLEGKRQSTFYITMGVAVVGLSFLLLILPGIGGFFALVMILLITIGEILAMPFMNTYWIGRTQNSNRGQYAALYTMAWSAAQCIGPLTGAQVVQHFNFTTLWWGVGCLALVASFAFWRLHKATFTGLNV
jgi:predicted MFS family arabinose efflux permease